MNNNEILSCEYCKYTTNRNYNLNRHQINKHSKELMKSIQNNNVEQNTALNEKYTASNEKNTDSNKKNTDSNEKITAPNEKNIIFLDKKEYNCKKCNKIFLTTKNLIKHENKCNGLDVLACPKCKKIFSSRQNKYHHIKRNTCKPKIEIIKVEENIKIRKQHISATMKRLVWNENIGEETGKSKCVCCNTTDITQLSFNCGHIVAEANGGENIVSNLRPICQNCNSSMGTTNMNVFMESLK